MRATPPRRCPYCGLELRQLTGNAVLPGMLVVCAGCAGPSRFDDARERLVTLGPGDLTESVAADVLGMQERVRATWGPQGRPPGYWWRTAALCGPCQTEFDPDWQPCVAKGVPSSLCAFCGERTDSGIYRRLLLPV